MEVGRKSKGEDVNAALHRGNVSKAFNDQFYAKLRHLPQNVAAGGLRTRPSDIRRLSVQVRTLYVVMAPKTTAGRRI